ncbi:hypothetical protein GE09DRAFT_1287224 [Coniochaeta sp. 2T2.1]|nr:hypothetical protein GE09DRAFT_1287224 [Coniochaeta sp. 2T2.1]
MTAVPSKQPDTLEQDGTDPLQNPAFLERRRRQWESENQSHLEPLRRATAAIRGEQASERLIDHPEGRRCLVRGIRYHDGFANKLRQDSAANFPPLIRRALNARDIMSNRIPDMAGGGEDSEETEDIPYCFWHPDVPTEDTLRELLRRYRSTAMRYQVGRACAVAGYTGLYRELDLLPDVAIAEEARDSGDRGSAIYELVVAQPTRYAVMDDYSRTVRQHPVPGACLNGDTCVRSTLDKRQSIKDENGHQIDVWEPMLDIAEDWRVDIEGRNWNEGWPVDPEAVQLLHQPLPRDLPTVDKNLLILMVACLMRGIHHNTFFAKWYAEQPGIHPLLAQSCNARFLMNNDTSWATDSLPDGHLPRQIWYPGLAAEDTYRDLARRKPAMVPQIARACIAADYECLFDDLDPVPEYELNLAASESRNRHYTDYLFAKTTRMAADSGKAQEDSDPGERQYDSDSSYARECAIDSVYGVLMAETRTKRSDALFYVPPFVSHLPRELSVDHVSFEGGVFQGAIGSAVCEILVVCLGVGPFAPAAERLPRAGSGGDAVCAQEASRRVSTCAPWTRRRCAPR